MKSLKFGKKETIILKPREINLRPRRKFNWEMDARTT